MSATPSPREPIISRAQAIDAIQSRKEVVIRTRDSQWAGSETWKLNDAAISGFNAAINEIEHLANLPALDAQPDITKAWLQNVWDDYKLMAMDSPFSAERLMDAILLSLKGQQEQNSDDLAPEVSP